MANELRIDLSDPAMAEALAECVPGETSTLTMDVVVTEKGAELVGTVDPTTVEKYTEELEEEMPPAVAPAVAPAGAPPAAVTAVAGNV